MCAMIGLNIAAAIASMIPISSGQETANAVDGTGKFKDRSKKFDPNLPLANVLNCPAGNPACDCSSPSANLNMLCGKAALENLKGQLSNVKGQLTQGTLNAPEGQTAEDMLSAIDNANAGLDSLLNGEIPGSGVETASIGDVGTGGKGSGSGKNGSDVLYGGSGSASDFDMLSAMGGGNGKAGPSDRSGLGRIFFNGGLDAIDEATGKSLTIWQRSTRRYQGDEKGSRAFLMAKVEVMRKLASKGQTMAKAGEAPLKAPAASRAPASAKLPPVKKIKEPTKTLPPKRRALRSHH